LAANRNEIEKLLKDTFAEICPNNTLRIYGIPAKSLKDFMKTNDKDNGEPDAKYRLRDEELTLVSKLKN